MASILFSPIGRTDPIRGNYDGGWLHICRHYRPEMTVIFLTAEMCAKDEKGDIYARTLEFLNQKLYGDETEKYIKLRKLSHPELEDAHSLEKFFPLFRDALTQLHEAFPKHEILVNASSGTPGMKNTLACLYHMLSFPIKLVQVEDPHPDKKREATVGNDYDTDDEWEYDCDNEDGEKNRCREQQMESFLLEVRKRDIREYVDKFDYYTAYEVAKSLGELLPQKALWALEGAVKRVSMFTEDAGRLFSKAKWHYGKTLSEFGKVTKDANAFICAEYLMAMEVACKRGNIAECLRMISPLFCDVCELLLKEQGVDVHKVGVGHDNKWHIENMTSDIRDIMNNEFNKRDGKNSDSASSNRGFRDKTDLAPSNMRPLIEAFCDKEIADSVNKVRKVEGSVRNIAAHEITGINKEWVKDKTRMTIEDVQSLLRGLIGNLSGFKKTQWKSYKEMNEFIKGLLD